MSLFADPIAGAASPPGDPVPVTQTLYRMADGRYVIRTCLDGGDPACDVMIYADADALCEALSAGGLDGALLAAAGLDRDPGARDRSVTPEPSPICGRAIREEE